MNRTLEHSAAFRLTAVVALFVWLLGQTLCLQHCAKLTFAKGGQECCAQKGDGQTKSPAGGSKTLCGSLKLAKLETNQSLHNVATLPPPSFVPIAFLVVPRNALDVRLPACLRTLPRADWVFLPKMSFGAALRSLAPPALA